MSVDFDAAAPETFDSPHEVYADLRGRCPVARTDAFGGFWALTRYADVAAAAKDSQTYISSVRAVVPSDPRGIRRPPLNFDAPRHSPFRQALDRTLRRGRLDALEPILRAHAVKTLQPMLDAGSGDICREFGTSYPAFVAAEWLNLNHDMVEPLAHHSTIWVNAWRNRDAAAVNEHSERMYDIARALVADRRQNPLDPMIDPASSLLAQEYEGVPLDVELVVGALRQSLVVGLVAPPIVLGSIAVHLARDPALHAQLRAQPELIPEALEEFLRLYTPYRGFARTVSRPVELHGRTIQPEEPITLVFASANRDSEVFEDGDEFRLGRENIGQHLAFGRGTHRCVGMGLARLSLRIALEELLARTVAIQITGDIEPTRMPELGPQSVPVRFVLP